MPAATGSRYRFAAARKAALSCVVGCKKASGFATKLDDDVVDVGWSSIDGG